MSKLHTPDAVIAVLGGTTAVASLVHRSVNAVSSWKARGKFPASSFVILTEALRAKGYTAPPSLWGMSSVGRAA